MKAKPNLPGPYIRPWAQQELDGVCEVFIYYALDVFSTLNV